MLSKRFLLVVLVSFCAEAITAQNAEQEANLKAAFIYNFTKYIDWGRYDHGSDFVIGIVGDSPITESLNEIARQNTVDNKRIVIKTINSPAEIADCDILFIPKKSRFSLNYLLGKAGPGVLTITEQKGLAKQGAAFNFVIINNRLKFEANLKAISAAGLKAGSQLLKLAIIVD
jgi:hypothetical protein